MDEQNTARASIDAREAEILGELLRLLRTDAEIMGSVRDMVRAAAEEGSRRPAVLLQAPSPNVNPNEVAVERQASTIGGQLGGTLGGMIGTTQVSQPAVFGQLLELVKDEKKFIQELITRILRL